MAVDKGNRPLRRLPTLDKDPKRLLKLWQQEGRIPERFTSWEQLDSEFLDLLEKGKTQAEARKALGVTYKNILGQHILEKNKSSAGRTRGLNKRAIRIDYNVASEQFLRKEAEKNKTGSSKHPIGQDFVDKEKARLLADWNKLSEVERVAVQEAFDKQFHKGHGYSALSGGSISIDNMWPEHERRNVLHGSSPRWPVEIMRRLNITSSDLQDAYDKILEREGLGLDLRPDNPQAIAMDEYMVQPTGKGEFASPGQLLHDPEAGLNPDRAEMLISRQRQLEAQGVSRQAIENYNRNLSGTLSIGTAEAESPPARTIVEGNKKLKSRVSTEGGKRTTTRTLNWTEIPEGGAKTLNPAAVSDSYKAAAGLKPTTPKPKIGGLLGGAAVGTGLSYLMGESPSQAAAGNIPIVSDITSDTAAAERVGSLFVDPVTNRILPQNKAQINTGLAYRNGKPVAVPYGSLRGSKGAGTIIKESVEQIIDVNKKRIRDFWKFATGL